MEQSNKSQSEQTQPLQRFQCPACKRPITFPSTAKPDQLKSFPFCSERCKLIDLGAWLDAEYRIPSRPEEASEEALTDGFGDPEMAP